MASDLRDRTDWVDGKFVLLRWSEGGEDLGEVRQGADLLLTFVARWEVEYPEGLDLWGAYLLKAELAYGSTWAIYPTGETSATAHEDGSTVGTASWEEVSRGGKTPAQRRWRRRTRRLFPRSPQDEDVELSASSESKESLSPLADENREPRRPKPSRGSFKGLSAHFKKKYQGTRQERLDRRIEAVQRRLAKKQEARRRKAIQRTQRSNESLRDAWARGLEESERKRQESLAKKQEKLATRRRRRRQRDMEIRGPDESPSSNYTGGAWTIAGPDFELTYKDADTWDRTFWDHLDRPVLRVERGFADAEGRLPYNFTAQHAVSLVVPLFYWYLIGGFAWKDRPRFDYD